MHGKGVASFGQWAFSAQTLPALPRSSGSTAAAASAPVQGGCTSPAFAARIQRDAPLMMCYLEVGQ